MIKIKTGLDRLLKGEYSEFKRYKLGLVINHTSVDQNMKFSLDELCKQDFSIQALFAPEHGFRGDQPAGQQIEHSVDPKTGIPVYSLYGKSKRPMSEQLKGLDALIFDMQDLGVRFYTYIYTLANTMAAAAEAGITYIVLDRPNPITGVRVEGNLIDPKFESFVGNYGLPTRHGMTIGELARYFNEHNAINCDLTVIPMEGWRRENWFDQTGGQWVMPSPNATGMEMMTLYPGTCLFEGTNVSEGRGTTKPFEVIGAPWIKAEEWVDKLESLNLPGVGFRATYFTPITSKYKGELCQGVQVHVLDRDLLQPIPLAYHMIISLKKIYPDEFQWTDPIKGRYFIDLLAGTDRLRKYIDEGSSPVKWLEEQEQSLHSFQKIREKYLIYS